MLVTLKTRLTAKKELAKDVYLLKFDIDEPSSFTFAPGQYVILLVPQENGVARRLFSVASSAADSSSFELLVKYLPEGLASQYFRTLKTGDAAMFQGPAGIFTLCPFERDIMILATGTGFAPIRSMLDHIYNRTEGFLHHVRLYWGFPTFADVYMIDELMSLSERQGFTFSICLSRETSIDHIPAQYQPHIRLGRVTQAWDEDMKLLGDDHGSAVNTFDYYVCGGREIVEGLRQYMYEHGVDKQRVHFEKF